MRTKPDARGKSAAVSVAVLTAAVFLVYAGAFAGQFVYDDVLLVTNNIFLRSWSHLGRIFTSSLYAGAGHPGGFYRPLPVFSLLVDYSLWKLNPAGYHLTSVLFHLAAAVLFYFLAWRLTGEKKSALFAGLLFAVHPVQVEAVTYVSGRSDPMAAVFALLSLHGFMNAFSPGAGERRKIFSYCLALFSYLLALLCRETMLVFPFALLLQQSVFGEGKPGTTLGPGRGNRKRIFLRTIPFFILAAVYLLWRRFVLSGLMVPSGAEPPALRLLTAARVFFLYLGLLVLPRHLHMERSIPAAGGLFDGPYLVSALFLAAALSAIFLFRRRKIFFFGACWFCLFLFPVSNVIPLNATMAEHWLYFPSLGLFLVAGALPGRLRRGRRIAAAGLILLLGVYGLTAARQNEYWRDEAGFYLRTLRYAPGSSRLHNNLGEVYLRRDEHEKAVAEFRRAIEINPRDAGADNNLGVVYRKTGRLPEAEAAFRQALALKPDYVEAHVNLGRLYLAGGKAAEAAAEFETAVKINPFNPGARYQLGCARMQSGRAAEAEDEFRRALALDPRHRGAREALGELLARAGRYEEAARIRPDSAEARNNLGLRYLEKAKHDRAISEFRIALRINPRFPEARYNLGNAYLGQGRREEAATEYRRALELKPDYGRARNNLGVIYLQRELYEQALAEFQQAVEIEPDLLDARSNQGVTYYLLGRYDEARSSWEQVLARQPDYPPALAGLEKLKEKSGDGSGGDPGPVPAAIPDLSP